MAQHSPLPLAPIVRPAARRLIPPRPHVDEGSQPRLPELGTVSPPTSAVGVPAGVRRLAQRLSSVLVEVLQGRRPLTHLEAIADDEVLATVEHLVRARVGHGLRLRNLRVQAPDAHAAELTLHLVDERREASRAAALRMECQDGRWQCTAIEIALTTDGITRSG